MMKSLLIAATLPATFLLVAVAGAQEPQAPKPIKRADYMKTVDARFRQIDSNHDGKITKDEVAAELQREMRIANARIAQQLQAKFRQLDTNHDGVLSLKEFMAIQPALHPTETPDQMFQRLDRNHDGKITADEFRGPEAARFDHLDANHDGIVTPAELAAASR